MKSLYVKLTLIPYSRVDLQAADNTITVLVAVTKTVSSQTLGLIGHNSSSG